MSIQLIDFTPNLVSTLNFVFIFIIEFQKIRSRTKTLKEYIHHKNFIKYFINTQQWAKQDDIEVFYFSSFDESWKVGSEGDVGAYWGIWDKNEDLKF